MAEEISPLENHGWWMEQLRKDAKALALRLAERLERRRLTRWVHATGETPRASGYVVDQDCAEGAAELRRLHAENERLTNLCYDYTGQITALRAAEQMRTRIDAMKERKKNHDRKI